jgi:hypothetical protein
MRCPSEQRILRQCYSITIMPNQGISKINRHTKVIRQAEKVSIVFRGNVNSFGLIIPSISIFMAGNFLYNHHEGYSKMDSGFVNFMYIWILISLILIATESTLTYSIHIDKAKLSIVASRIGIKVRKEIAIRKITSIQRIEKSYTMTSGSTFYKPRLCIYHSNLEEILPLALNENDIDEVIKLFRKYINSD